MQSGVVVVVIVWYLDLQLPMQSVPIVLTWARNFHFRSWYGIHVLNTAFCLVGGFLQVLWFPQKLTMQRKVHSGIINLFDERIVYSPDKDSFCSKWGTTQKYCETVYSRSGINHMWILKNSKDLLDNLKSRYFSPVSSIKTFDLSTLFTTLPYDKLKSRLKETIHKAFRHRNYSSKFVVLDYNST